MKRFCIWMAGLLLAALTPSRTWAQQPQALTLQEAEKIAVQNHPHVQAAEFLAKAASERVRESRSVYYPTVGGSLTGVKTENDSRIAAGFLNNPSVFSRFADGIALSQVVTDFGRSYQLVKSSNLHAKAQAENVTTARADVIIRVDQAYYGVLKAQAVLRVAQETVKDRQLVADQVGALAKNQLKSGLDVSFANVDLARAQLLLVQAQNDLQSSFAELSTALGYSDQRTFQLADQPLPSAPPTDISTLIQEAMQDRPEIVSQRFDTESAFSFATAERDLWFPTISAVGVAGLVPYREAPLPSRYAAAGFNVNIPIFNGHLFDALRGEANAEARAQQQSLRDTQNVIIREVQKAWLNAISGYQRLALTDQLLDQATKAFDLAQSRYHLGLSSIIELSQAELNKTQAEIDQASAKYDYQIEISALNYQAGQIR